MTIKTFNNAEIYIQIDGNDLPETISINSAVIRENYEWAVPSLDLVIIDSTNSINLSTIQIKDGSIISIAIYMPGKPKEPRSFLVTSIKPQVIHSQSVYYVSAIFNSYLITTTMDTWSFTGTVSDAWQNIITNDKQASVKLQTDLTNTNSSSFLKYKNETFAKYIRRVLLPMTSSQDGTSYYCYYHDGYNCYLQDANKYMATNNTPNPSNFTLVPNLIIRWKFWSDSFLNNQNTSSYNSNMWQYNVDEGDYVQLNKSTSNVLYNINLNQTEFLDNRTLITGSNMGNHTPDYLQSSLNNLRNSGIYHNKLLVQINFDSFTTGLQVINFKYKNNLVIPFLIVGKSTIFRNSSYEEHILLTTNNIDTTPTKLFSSGS